MQRQIALFAGAKNDQHTILRGNQNRIKIRCKVTFRQSLERNIDRARNGAAFEILRIAGVDKKRLPGRVLHLRNIDIDERWVAWLGGRRNDRSFGVREIAICADQFDAVR